MWLLLGLVPALVFAQAADPASPDPRELIRRSADAIKQFRSYQLESIVSIDTQGGPIRNTMEMPSTISVRRPDRMRIESRSQAGSITIVGDGDYTWFYMTPLKKYIKRAALGSPEAAVGNAGLLPKNLPDVTKSIKSVRLMREEEISIAGENVPCWVIETAYDQINLPQQELAIEDAAQITWISKKHGLNLQTKFSAKLNLPGVPELVKMTLSTQTTALRLNIDLPDSLFVFKPPAGAKETEDWTLPGITKPELTGKPAPQQFAELRGKVVLLNFCASWCASCKRDLPGLEKLFQEFKDQGLVVIGFDVGEEKSVFDGVTYSMRPIPDSDDLLSALSITALPTTVLIDREGNIAAYEVGTQGEAALRANLAKLGLRSK